MAEEPADALGAALASSRPITETKWLPKSRQVGKSGKTDQPDRCIATGISGARSTSRG